ncbi:hypothetical protein BO71DRAFT_381064 [Aspergillus ellipticus CBS 707.79]|uniref:Nucleotidyl transferase n=1 Tax=Aspergillus ellipticus CBS 707.79 TaxID=1448320 RepID=A0A319D8N0_9EURO|nr:hypothetical protein BO71DRAFT_381064 [Aspergillus ellipticus CBS 707.79]
MAMNQPQLPVPTDKRLYALDLAAKQVTAILDRLNCRHAYIGGYAVSLLGSNRVTAGLDVIVSSDPLEIREKILRSSTAFRTTEYGKLVCRVEDWFGDKKDVFVDVFRGGGGGAAAGAGPLTLPDAGSVPIYLTKMTFLGTPVIHPPVLIHTKLQKWMSISQSPTPEIQTKAANDLHDIETILKWLSKRHLRVDFAGYPEMSKDRLLSMFRELCTVRWGGLQELVGKVLEKEDFEVVRLVEEEEEEEVLVDGME